MKNSIFSNSLTGKKIVFLNNLQGKPLETGGSKRAEIPYAILKLKKKIIDMFIIPIHLQKWKRVKENIFLISRLKNKIEKYKKIYTSEDLEIYEYLMTFITSVFSEHVELEQIEKQIYSDTSGMNLASLLHKTPYVRLKAEYEIYHLLYGKPNKKKNESYNKSIIQEISELLEDDDVTFDDIKSKLITEENE